MRGTDETTMVKNYQRLHGIAGKRVGTGDDPARDLPPGRGCGRQRELESPRDVSWAKCTGLWWVL